ncbi:MAG: TonB family protein [Sulfuritalea sp.]|jgi:protein TonB|nr:TonB family protein [Sulfuritalea sp.]
MTFHSLELRGLTTRRLRYALAASLAVHLLIFWPASLRVLTKDTPSALQATLRTLQQPPVESTPAKPPRAVPPAPTVATPAPKPVSLRLEQAGPSSVPQALLAPSDAALKSAPVSEPVPVVVSKPLAVAPGSIDASLVTEVNATGEAMDGLRGYRLALATQARRFKRYPAQAMASGWVGSAAIRVEVGDDGRPRAATVDRSSGRESLDQAALAMIDAGALRARLPESLRGKAFAVVLPVVFNLDDE